MSLAVASRYARALVDIVQDAKSGLDAATAARQLDNFQAMLDGSRELREALITPAVNNTRKRAVVSKLAEEAGFHRLFKSFLFVLIDHRRTPLFAAIRQSFQAQLDELSGAARAEVSSSTALPDEQKAALLAKLAAKTGKKVVCNYTVDPALLGGVTVRMGSKVYDGSVRGQFDALRRKLATSA